MKNTIYSGRTIALERELLKSAAYRSLTTGAAHQVLSGFLLSRQLEPRKDPHKKRMEYWEVVNDGRLTFTYAEAERLGISAGRFRDAIDLLLDRGFIRIAKTGEGRFRGVTLYGLSDGWKKWKPGESINKRKKRKAADRPGGFKSGKSPERNGKIIQLGKTAEASL